MLKSVLVVGVSVAALAGIGVVAGVPMVHGWLDERHEQEGTYPTGKEAKADRVAMPAWLPDGATDVHFKFRTTDGNRILTARLPDGKLPPACVATSGHHRPGLTAAWFPQGVVHKETVRCGKYWGYTEKNTLYAWQRDRDAGNEHAAEPVHLP
ncbi:MAG: hypothetical protein HOU01_13500 [Streptomycetaceae bacterium]|jgi:hypothetical protein|nr:hypothetical protein [Streptomycetaceae bacterium]